MNCAVTNGSSTTVTRRLGGLRCAEQTSRSVDGLTGGPVEVELVGGAADAEPEAGLGLGVVALALVGERRHATHSSRSPVRTCRMPVVDATADSPYASA